MSSPISSSAPDRFADDALTIAVRVNHDLRSPLSAVVSGTDLLGDVLRAAAPEELALLQPLHGSVDRVLAILQDVSLMLRASYGPRPEAEAFSMGEVADPAADRAARRQPRGGAGVQDRPQEWPRVHLVRDWVWLVWRHLLHNAAEHGGPDISIGWEKAAGGGAHIYHVRDNGPGLDEVRTAEPFPAFESLHTARHLRGLGLPLARRMVELMGGSLHYRRTADGLTEFSFTLPDVLPPAAPAAAPAASAPAVAQDGTGGRVTSFPGAPRLTALLNHAPEPEFDAATRLARTVLQTPLAMVSLVDGDRLFFKSVAAAPGAWSCLTDAPLCGTVCRHVVEGGEPLVVEDARVHTLLQDIPAVSALGIVAYMGVPVWSAEGGAVGSVCVIDSVPRAWSPEQLASLQDLACVVQREILLRTKIRKLEQMRADVRGEQTLNRTLLDYSGDCIKVLDIEGGLLEMNEPGMCLMEIPDFAPLRGKAWHSIWPEEVRPLALRAMEEARAGRSGRFQGQCPTMRGNVKWWDVIVTGIAGPDGVVHQLLSISRDITSVKEAEMQVRGSETLFRTLANHLSQFVWIANSRVEVSWYNQRWYEYTGTTLEEMQGHGWMKVHHPDHAQRVMDKASASFALGEAWEDTFPLRARDGSYRWFLSRAIPIRDDSGEIVRWFGTNTDITTQLETEEAYRRAAQAKDNFIAVLSHELRTPLNPALLVASAAATRTDLAPDVLRDFDVIRRHIEMEARLIDDLLDLTHVTRGKLSLVFSTVDLNQLVEETVAALAEEAAARGITLHRAGPAGAVYLSGDEVRLRQVLTNVLRNALKFTPRGGTVTLRTATEDGWLRLTVADTGHGMTAEEMTHVFEAFAQGDHASGASHKFGGLGLGLAISRELITLHGGNITAASDGRDQGAVITISLPLPERTPAAVTDEAGAAAPAAAPADTSVHAGAPVPGSAPRPLRILIAEDHTPTRETLAMLLRRRGHEVHETATAADALEAAQNTAPAARAFDLLISDIGLPDARGDELLRRLRAAGLHFPGIALSGYGMDADVQRSHEAGYSIHLTKPVSMTDLDRALRRICG